MKCQIKGHLIVQMVQYLIVYTSTPMYVTNNIKQIQLVKLCAVDQNKVRSIKFCTSLFVYMCYWEKPEAHLDARRIDKTF